eukprot:TRINITY_DN10621_c0_g3_i1.p1 TRINITY_DN10621_c0_g3~~TRINITY_DN10621_c0_g3_i1.p1  ORF type:complete len:752 (-),score=219.75 TRINITY_DN10621_c0_g3_i1:75-2330(-)
MDSLRDLLEERSRQNEELLQLVPEYLETMADDLAEMEPRLSQPEKRKKWAGKVSAKVVERLPLVEAFEQLSEADLDRLTAQEDTNRRQVATALHRIRNSADIMRVMYALEHCLGSAFRVRCEAEGIKLSDKEPTDLLTKVNSNLKQWYSQVTSEDRWRYAFFRSEARTAAYAAAVQRAAAGKRVVDIGVGSGMLAMLAGRVAAEVLTVETSKTAFAAVEKTIAANGLAEAVKVVGSVKEAIELASRDDMPVVLTVEILSAVPITGELKTALEIRSALGEQCCGMIPEGANLVAAPANIPPQRVLLECPLLHQVCGFDLKFFNEFRLHKPMPHQLSHLDHTLLAAPQVVLEMDLSDLRPDMSHFEAPATEPASGLEWNSVVAWYELQLDELTTIGSGPEHQDALQAIQYLPGPFKQLQVNQDIRFGVAHNGSTFGFSFECNGSPCEMDGAGLLRWHWGMLNDEYRNGLYNEAIQAAVAKKKSQVDEMLVLDIGTGSGLLSMMCSRAGADQIVAVEMVEPLVHMARRITAHNGYHNITVHNKMSTALELEAELPRKADLLVSEIVDVALLGEHMVPAVADASQRLLADGAVMIPCAATLLGCLLQVPAQPGVPGQAEHTHHMQLQTEVTVPGSEMYQQLLLNRLEHEKLSEVFDVFHFDFYKCAEYQQGANTTLEVTTTSAGRLDAVGLWFNMLLDEERSISTAPAAGEEKDTCWQQALMWLQGSEEDRTFSAGEVVKLKATHDGVRIRLTLA